MSFMRDGNVYQESVSYDEGLRAYMVAVFNYMALALGLTGGIAFITASSPAIMQTLHGSGLIYLVMFAPLGLVLFLSFKIHSMKIETARFCFWGYAALMGLSLSSIFMVYTGESIAKTFFVSSALFGAMAIYGNNTKRDLTSMGSFLIMGVIGIVIASIANIFIKSGALHFVTSLLGVIIFTGLTAYDVQKLKRNYYALVSSSVSNEEAAKYGIMSSLELYMDFINIFVHLLQFMGDRR